MSDAPVQRALKPLLVIPPAPSRWPGLKQLPLHDDPLAWQDLEQRFAHGLPGAHDAFALALDGGNVIACAAICKRHDLGVLNRVLVRPEHRRRGHGRAVLETILSWFDMTGGKWLYTTTTVDVADGYLAALGFRVLRRAPRTPHDAVVALRRAAGAIEDPLAKGLGNVTIHAVTRANFPTLAVLLYNRSGADPRIPLDESAVQAEQTVLELIARQEANTCVLQAAFQGVRLIALGSLALDVGADRTYGMILPHDAQPPQLRSALLATAHERGFAHLDFPLEALREAGFTPVPPSGAAGPSSAAPASGTPEEEPGGAAALPSDDASPARPETGETHEPHASPRSMPEE